MGEASKFLGEVSICINEFFTSILELTFIIK